MPSSSWLLTSEWLAYDSFSVSFLTFPMASKTSSSCCMAGKEWRWVWERERAVWGAARKVHVKRRRRWRLVVFTISFLHSYSVLCGLRYASCTWNHGASRIIFSQVENCMTIDRDLEGFCRGGPLIGLDFFEECLW